MPVVTAKVASGADDTQERVSNGAIQDNVAVNMTANTNTAAAWYGAFRMVLNVPQGATILSATPRFFIAGGTLDNPEGTLYLEDADDAAALTTTSGNISGRTRTTASRAWSAVDMVVNGRWISGPDMTAVVQEVVDRAGFSSGNHICLIWVPSTATSKSFSTVAYDSDSTQATELVVAYSDGSGTMIDVAVTAGADDAHEFGDGAFASNATWLNVYPITDTGVTSSSYRSSAVVFHNLNIPQGATILAAYVELRNRLGNGIACTVYGEDVDSAVDFTTNANILSRTRTTANADWDQDFMGAGYVPSPDLTAIIQEIVDRPGWSSGGSIAILLIAKSNTPNMNLGAKQEEFAAFENALGLPPVLHVEWDSGGAGGGDVTVTPAAAAAKAAVTGPTLVLGSVAVSPAAAVAKTAALTPTVVLGSITLSPAPATAKTAVVAPGVSFGSVLISPTPAGAKAATISPVTILGSITISPAPATAGTSTRRPFIPTEGEVARIDQFVYWLLRKWKKRKF